MFGLLSPPKVPTRSRECNACSDQIPRGDFEGRLLNVRLSCRASASAFMPSLSSAKRSRVAGRACFGFAGFFTLGGPSPFGLLDQGFRGNAEIAMRRPASVDHMPRRGSANRRESGARRRAVGRAEHIDRHRIEVAKGGMQARGESRCPSHCRRRSCSSTGLRRAGELIFLSVLKALPSFGADNPLALPAKLDRGLKH